MRKRVSAILSLALLSTPAWAHSYRIVLSSPSLVGHAGVQALDDKTSMTHVRLISPGAEVRQRGTIRVLVMNLGSKPFAFGPEQVTLTLADGTVLKPTPIEEFIKGKDLITRESHRAGIIDRQNRGNLAALSSQGNSGMTAQSITPVPGGSTASGSSFDPTFGQDRTTEDLQLPGAKTLDAIGQVLETESVPPQTAWGGYYVFDLPKAVYERRADQPLTILVTTGGEQHRFNATLKWK